MTDPPVWARDLALAWSPEPLTALVVAVAAAGYGLGLRRLSATARRWPGGRSAAFAAGLVLLTVATQSGIAAYDTSLFSAHAVQHVLLGMAAPLLLALGAPVTLALQALSGPARRLLLDVVHGPVVGLATHPAVAPALVVASLFGLYFTPLFELSLRNEVVHAAVHVHFLLAGCAFFWPVLGLDVGRRRLPHGARMLLVLMLVPVHALVGITILSSRRLLAGGWYAAPAGRWGTDALADQHVAGGLLWVTGDLIGLAAAIVVLAQWMAHDDREAARHDRRLDALEALGAEDHPASR